MHKITVLIFSLFLSASVASADGLSKRIADATSMLDNKQGSTEPIPPAILANAKAVAFCTVTKAGIGIGGLGGEGLVVVRRPGQVPGWTAPIAFNLSGGSIGAQLGFTTDRLIFILNTDEAVQQFTSAGKVKWNATAAGTAGQDNAAESANSADLGHRAVIVYKDTAGLFGGATLGGTSIEVKSEINHDYYEPHFGTHSYLRDILDGAVYPPKSANRLYTLLDGQR
jgi:lipid-binding SYLF domain-containing protein